jgi:hypothetical protein
MCGEVVEDKKTSTHEILLVTSDHHDYSLHLLALYAASARLVTVTSQGELESLHCEGL